jgi:hypothetical protein
MKVFVSSPYGGLADEREAVRGALDPPHAIEMMEEFGSSGLPPLETCIEKLVKCRVCVLIVGPRYGTPVPNLDISYTEAEYETARERGIKVFAYVVEDFGAKVDGTTQSDSDRQRQRELKAMVEAELTVDQAYYSDPSDLAAKTRRDIDTWAAAKSRPRFRRRRGPAVKDEGAYAAGRTRRAAGSLYPYPIVLVDVAAAALERYPAASAGRVPRKLHEIYQELNQRGAQITIFNDIPVTDLTAGTTFDQRLAIVRNSDALVVCLARRESDLARLAEFHDAGSDRALWIAVWLDDPGTLPASYTETFTGDELSECAVALRASDYLKRKIDAHLVGKVSSAGA